MIIQSNENRRLRILFLIFIYSSLMSPFYLFATEIEGALDNILPATVLAVGRTHSLPGIFLICLSLFLPLAVVLMIWGVARPRVVRDSLSIRVRNSEIRKDYTAYLNFEPGFRFFIMLPGFRSGSFVKRILASVYYAASLLPMVGGYYFLTSFFISLPFIVFGLREILHRKGKRRGFGWKLAFLLTFMAISAGSLFLMALGPGVNGLYRNTAAVGLCSAANTLEQLGFSNGREALLKAALTIQKNNPRPYLDQGELLEAQGKNLQAEELYRKVLEQDAGSSEVYYRLSRLYARRNETDQAFELLNTALELDPGYIPALFELGLQAAEGNEAEAAARFLERIRTADNTDYRNDALQGRILAKAGQLTEAAAVYSRAIDKEPGDETLYNYKAELQLQIGKIDEALFTVDSALVLQPLSRDLLYLKGMILLKKNDFEKAGESFKHALAQDPAFLPASCGRVMSAIGQRDLAKAEEMLMEIQNAYKDEPLAAYTQAYQYKEAGKYDDALKMVDTALKMEPENSLYGWLKAEILVHLFMSDQAGQQIQRMMNTSHASQEAFETRGLYLLQLNDYMEADKVFDQALQYNPYSVVAYAGKAITANAMNDREKADELLVLAAETDPENYFVYYAKSRIEYERKLFRMALKDINRALEQAPEHTILYLHKTRVLASMGMEADRDSILKQSEKLASGSVAVALETEMAKTDGAAALAGLAQFTASYPDHYLGHLYTAETLFKLGRYAEAEAAVDRAIKLNQKDYRGYLLKYRLLHQMSVGSSDEVVGKRLNETLESLLKVNPYFRDAYFYKASEFMKQGSFQAAADMLNSALPLQQNYQQGAVRKSQLYASLKDAYMKLGDGKKAAEASNRLESIKKLESLDGNQ